VIAFICAVPPPLRQADSSWQGFPDTPAAGALLAAEPPQPATARQAMASAAIVSFTFIAHPSLLLAGANGAW
jgi:hypothetical protein